MLIAVLSERCDSGRRLPVRQIIDIDVSAGLGLARSVRQIIILIIGRDDHRAVAAEVQLLRQLLAVEDRAAFLLLIIHGSADHRVRDLCDLLPVYLHDDELVFADDIEIGTVRLDDIALIHAFHLNIGAGIIQRTLRCRRAVGRLIRSVLASNTVCRGQRPFSP